MRRLDLVVDALNLGARSPFLLAAFRIALAILEEGFYISTIPGYETERATQRSYLHVESVLVKRFGKLRLTNQIGSQKRVELGDVLRGVAICMLDLHEKGFDLSRYAVFE
jgi:hypothetical protein